jgi:cytoskeletal protein CcmA (bactofilin family)
MAGQNVTIAGTGSLSGGKYGNIRIFGEGNIMSPVQSVNMKIFGSLNTNSEICADNVFIAGSANFTNTKANRVNINGSAHFHSSATLKYLTVNGEAHFEGELKAVKIILRGEMISGKLIEAESFHSRGALTVKTLNADHVCIALHSNCRAEEIGAETVKVYDIKNSKRLADRISYLFNGDRKARLEVGIIEADRIYLENTTADAVRGNEVIIGPGCQIKKVEYKTTFQVDSSSNVDVTEQF